MTCRYSHLSDPNRCILCRSDLVLKFEKKQKGKYIWKNSEMPNIQQPNHLASKYEGRKLFTHVSDVSYSYINGRMYRIVQKSGHT
jgi:hypothetical protein